MLRRLTLVYMAAILIGAPTAQALGAGRPLPVTWLALDVALWAAFGSVAIVWALRWLRPPGSAFMLLARRGLRRAGSRQALEHIWVGESCLPAALRLAAIAGEDTYFAFHEGFDWESLRAAYAANQGAERKRGGSTISQQVAKNLFLWPAQSYLRKGLEAYFTLLLEAAWPKRRILEVYLNIAQFGPCTFGAEAAARRYLGKSARELTTKEAALLVAVLPSPVRYRADQPSHLVRYRQVMILANMKKLGAAYLARLGAEPATAA